MTRRSFWSTLAALGLVGLGAGWNRARRATRDAAPRVVRWAERPRRFPGRVEPVRRDDIERAGRWAG